MPIIPWEKIGEPELLAEGFGKSFAKQKFRDHNGKAVDFFFFDQTPWSMILPLTSEGEAITVKQFKQGSESILEELPGGTPDVENESPEATVTRELLEETGYQPEKVIDLCSGWMNSRNSHTKFYCFLALDCQKIKEPELDPSEQIEIMKRPLKDWLRMVVYDESIQWGSVLTTIRALPHLKGRFDTTSDLLSSL